MGSQLNPTVDLPPILSPPPDRDRTSEYVPPDATDLDPAAPCPSALPCGTRLLGTLDRTGAVELRVPVLRW
jgi:hypothetical protein